MDNIDPIFQKSGEEIIDFKIQDKIQQENSIQEIEELILPKHFKSFNYTAGQGKMCSVSRS